MKTTYLKNKLLEHITGKTTFTKPSSTHLALFTADPTNAGDQSSEVVGGSYARKSMSWASAANGLIATNNAQNFTAMPATKIKYWAIMDASTGGNMLEYYPFEVPIQVPASGTFTVATGNVILSED